MIDLAFITKLNQFLTMHPASDQRMFSTFLHNAAIGGAKDSGHLFRNGNAVDLTFDSDLELLAGAANAAHYGFTGIELDLANKHLHLDTKPRLWQVVHHSPGHEEPLDQWIQQTYPSMTTRAA